MYLTADGEERERPLAVLSALEVASGQPVRIPPSHVGQTNYPGLFWSSTMDRHLVYESLLELSWLWLADFDQEVVAIAAQPMQLVGNDGDRRRTRYPDFLTVRADGRVVVVDVKAERMLRRQPVREALEWTARQIEGRGWEYLVWTGTPHTVLRNVRLIAAARRSRFVPQATVDAVVARCERCECVVAVRHQERVFAACQEPSRNPGRFTAHPTGGSVKVRLIANGTFG
jgi:hypothetical protein